MADSQQTISIPSLILLTAVSVVAVRYFFFPSTQSASNSASTQASRRADPNDVERIAMMFPQVPRRDIMWDLQRSGGSVAGTTERILARGSLDTPPQSFQPVIPTPSSSSSSQQKPEYMDLIKRYNLSEKVSSPPSTPGEGVDVPLKQQTWSTDKQERQAMLQKRREEMVLAARRKMEEQGRQKIG